jgi:predicted phosphodiesterase
VHAALDRAYVGAGMFDVVAGTDRLVIFSDHHKGARDGADDFQRCERAYNAALAYYNKLGYHLIELGDVEDLWENSFDEVAPGYRETLALAAAFHADHRYTRFWGNHDLAWKDTSLFQARMAAYGYGDVEPIEALRLAIHTADGEHEGELFLVHGHQGTADSDRYAALSRVLVRRVRRPLQRLVNLPMNTPSMDWALRGEHAEDMAAWATERRRVLIAGHTHLPVFFDSAKQPVVTPEQIAESPADSGAPDADALRLARTEWAKAEATRLERQRPLSLATPCYFNTGCCAFGDGDITGIEISDGEIRLLRWPCESETKPQALGAPLKLADVFRLTATGGGGGPSSAGTG